MADKPRILSRPEASRYSASEYDMFHYKFKQSITVYASFLCPGYTINDPCQPDYTGFWCLSSDIIGSSAVGPAPLRCFSGNV